MAKMAMPRVNPMIDDEHNLEPYQDVLAGLERLAKGLDQQTSPLSADQIARNCLLAPATGSHWFRSRMAMAAAAAVLVVLGLGIWLSQDSSQKSFSIAANMPGKALATAPAGTQTSASSDVISFAVPSFSLPSLSGTNADNLPSAGQAPLQVPALPKSESDQLKFEIPSITFPTLTERTNNES
jgi:hypothetical protein